MNTLRLIPAVIGLTTVLLASTASAGVCEDLKGLKLLATTHQDAFPSNPSYEGLFYFDFSSGVVGSRYTYAWSAGNAFPNGPAGNEVRINRVGACTADPANPNKASIFGQYTGESGANTGSHYLSITVSPDHRSYTLGVGNSLFAASAHARGAYPLMSVK